MKSKRVSLVNPLVEILYDPRLMKSGGDDTGDQTWGRRVDLTVISEGLRWELGI